MVTCAGSKASPCSLWHRCRQMQWDGCQQEPGFVWSPPISDSGHLSLCYRGVKRWLSVEHQNWQSCILSTYSNKNQKLLASAHLLHSSQWNCTEKSRATSCRISFQNDGPHKQISLLHSFSIKDYLIKGGRKQEGWVCFWFFFPKKALHPLPEWAWVLTAASTHRYKVWIA